MSSRTVGRCAERLNASRCRPPRRLGGLSRYRAAGPAGMADRSSRPHHSPGRTPTRTERRIIKVRVLRRWGPARIGYLLGLHPSTVHRVLTRYRMARLRWLDRPTGRVIRRIESSRCGDLVHIDVKKLGKIPAGGGWRMLGRSAGRRNWRADTSSGQRSKHGDPLHGHHFLHTALDGHSRLAYSELLSDERKETAAAFWRRANAWFSECGIDRPKSVDRQRFLLPIPRLQRCARRVLSTAEPDLTGRRPTEKWSDSTAPWPTNGPTPVSTPATPNAATSSPSGCTPTITTAATPHSAANHPPAAYLTCQVSTADM